MPPMIVRITRRDFLRLGAAAAALASAGCRGPVEEIVPLVDPETAPPGEQQFFATAMSLGGVATGLLVETNGGRPTKIEGNPSHPASLGAAGAFEQAAVLDFWDPVRASGITHAGQPATREALEGALRAQLDALAPTGGEGLRILVRYTSSPTLLAQLAAVRSRWPACKVHTWEPLHRDRSLAGARLAFGRAVDAVPHFDRADVVVAFDSDFLGEGPGHLRHARDFASRRKVGGDRPMSRLYAVECMPTLAGATADHRLALPPAGVALALAQLADALRGGAKPATPMLASAARDLRANAGRAVIVAGESLPPAAHALVHRLNGELQAPVDLVAPVAGDIDCTQSMRELAADLDAGRVKALLILDGNPAYDAPADLGFAEALARVPFAVHLALRPDETSAACAWHVPGAHFLEHWSDARAYDGTASIVQPLVTPLHGALSPHEVLAMLLPPATGNARDRVRGQWLRGAGDDDPRWREMLRAGVVPDSAFAPQRLSARTVAFEPPAPPPPWTVVLRADESARDGELAANAWLQELPRPHTKLTWDNAACMSPGSAAALGVETGDRIEIAAGARRIVAPVWVLPGQADGVVGLALGYGRKAGGSVARGVGVDAYPLRTADGPWAVHRVAVRAVEGRHDFAVTQRHSSMEGRDPVQRLTAAEAASGARAHDATPRDSLYPPWPYESYRWGMVVDLTSCIGCNACTIACQAENNIPTVGKEEVARGHAMHWIRVDRYYAGGEDDPRTHFQPVPCMHCESAPCEAVCPVGATVHDSEGVNVQVYNRCVGTRFCSNNCPYKVRRFNFLHYNARPETPPLEGRNPEVTVRMRGVMEKCNYCLQRITRARIGAERDGRRIADGDVVTACQAACPTRAITFGDLADPASAVSKAKRSPLDYALLAELATHPRTTYLARLSNPAEGEDG